MEKRVHGDGNHGPLTFGGRSVRRCRVGSAARRHAALCELCAARRCWRTAETALRRTCGTAARRGAARLSRKRADSPPFSANAVKQRCLRRAPRFPCRAQKGRSGRAALRLAPAHARGVAGLCGVVAPKPPLSAHRLSPNLPRAFFLLFVQAFSFHRQQFAVSDASLPPPGIF